MNGRGGNHQVNLEKEIISRLISWRVSAVIIYKFCGSDKEIRRTKRQIYCAELRRTLAELFEVLHNISAFWFSLSRISRLFLYPEGVMFVLGTAGFLLSCLPSLFDFGTTRSWQLQFPLSNLFFFSYLFHWMEDSGDIMLNAPVPYGSLKLSNVTLGWYLDGWPPGQSCAKAFSRPHSGWMRLNIALKRVAPRKEKDKNISFRLSAFRSLTLRYLFRVMR
jgi:hypothetical protein